MRADPKAVPSISLRWPMMSEVDVGGTILPIFHSILLLCYRWQQRDSDKMESDMKVCIKQRYVIEFLYVEKWHLLTFTDTCELLWRPNSGCEHSEVG